MAVTAGTHGGTGGESAALDGPTLTYGTTFDALEDRVIVVVTAGERSTKRVFDEAWLRGDEPAESIELPIDADHRYRVRLSGGSSCAQPAAQR